MREKGKERRKREKKRGEGKKTGGRCSAMNSLLLSFKHEI